MKGLRELVRNMAKPLAGSTYKIGKKIVEHIYKIKKKRNNRKGGERATLYGKLNGRIIPPSSGWERNNPGRTHAAAALEAEV